MPYCIKPDYKKKTIKERLYKLKFKLGEEYDEIDFSDITAWCSKVICKSKELNQKLSVDVDIDYKYSGGCDDSKRIICLIPFYNREETDEEYTKRIAIEEKAYNEYLEIRKLEEQQTEEYLKDLVEYERIKKKYNL